jgi:ABC-type antimicrobial peptide transport system permease subunit
MPATQPMCTALYGLLHSAGPRIDGVGLLLSVAVGKVLSSFLYKVSGADPVVFLAATILLSVISLLACYLPARNAAGVDPMVALRCE